jgi:salicylate hydroxylase
LKGVLSAIEKHPNIEIFCGKKTVRITEDKEGAQLHFQDGETVKGDVLIGCDGIHSVARLSHVEPERTSQYSGICNAFGFAPRRVLPDTKEYEPTHFETSGMNFGRRGMLLTSFFDEERESIYVGALMQVPEIASRDGW